MRPFPLLFFASSTALLHALAVAQPVELLLTPDCRVALAALSQLEDALIARGASAPSAADASPAKLQQLQRIAAKACLGIAEAAASGSAKRSPIPMPLPGVTRPGVTDGPSAGPQAGKAPGLAPASAPVRQAPLVTLGACDAQGCWASDGTRVQRLGPVLLGPRGYCTQTGTVLNCP